jgi:hypothetical protein
MWGLDGVFEQDIMLHSAYLDDTTINGRKMLKELRRYRKGVQLENSAANDSAPEGYMTSEEFRERAKKITVDLCKKYSV